MSDKHKEDVLYYVDFLPTLKYDDLSNYIQVKPHIETKIQLFENDYSITDSIGIHIRHTDKKPTSSFQKAINYINTKFNNKAVFLSTDSVEVEKLFSEQISNLILFPKTKPVLAGEGLHQWALYNNAEELKLVLFEESIIEMFLLSRCKYLFYQGNSTFSKVSEKYHLNKNNCYDWLKL